jgi:hypothetical protein
VFQRRQSGQCMRRISVPFKIPNALNGFAESEGIISLEGEIIRIEYQTQDSFFGLLRSDVNRIELNVAEIEEIGFHRGFLSSKMTIRSADFSTKALAELPGELRLSIVRRHRQAAAEFVRAVRSILFDLTLKQFEI